MDTKKIKFVIVACIAIVLMFGAYLFYLELDKGSSDNTNTNTRVVGE